MRHFSTADGISLAYRDEGSGRPLLLLHGLMAHGGFFDAQLPLADRYRLVRPDLPGHGQSGPAPRHSVESAADAIRALIEALELEDIIGIGWSLGASVLWRLLAGPAASRFAGAVVVDMTPRVLNEGEWQLGLSADACEMRSAAIGEDFAGFADAAARAMFAQPGAAPANGMADWAASEFAGNDPAAIAAYWESLVAEDLRAMLPRISQPTLVIHGAQSQLYGAETATHLETSLPDARAISFEQSGHAPHLDEPERFNRAVSEFAANLPPVSSSLSIQE